MPRIGMIEFKILLLSYRYPKTIIDILFLRQSKKHPRSKLLEYFSIFSLKYNRMYLISGLHKKDLENLS